MFRELNEQELAIISKLKKRGKLAKSWSTYGWLVGYRTSGNFTIAVLVQHDNYLGTLKIGVSKFNPHDKTNAYSTGQAIAFDRALINGTV